MSCRKPKGKMCSLGPEFSFHKKREKKQVSSSHGDPDTQEVSFESTMKW